MNVAFFDVGACTGDTVILASIALQKTGVRYHIYAFEACKKNVDELEKTKLVYPNISVIHCAVGQTEGKVKLYHAPGKESHSICSTKLYVNPNDFEEVDGIVFSSWFKTNIKTKPDVIIMKMNIEGAEYVLLRDLFESQMFTKLDVLLYNERNGYPIDLDKITLPQFKKDRAAYWLAEFKKFGVTTGIFAGLNYGTIGNFDIQKYVEEKAKR